jgi:zinc and cadmium transporter
MGGLLSVLAAALVMFGLPRKWLNYAVSFSIGLLLATWRCCTCCPKRSKAAWRRTKSFPVLLGGILAFFARWKSLPSGATPTAAANDLHQGDQRACDDHTHSHHHHQPAPRRHGFLILIGDGFHNFTDGLLIAAAFLADPRWAGLPRFAIIAHEVPQEAGDFAILLAAGWKRGRALFWNAASSLASSPAA